MSFLLGDGAELIPLLCVIQERMAACRLRKRINRVRTTICGQNLDEIKAIVGLDANVVAFGPRRRRPVRDAFGMRGGGGS